MILPSEFLFVWLVSYSLWSFFEGEQREEWYKEYWGRGENRRKT